MKNTRLAGHTLPDEGRIRDTDGYWTKTGAAVCSCGEKSEPLSSDNARRRWHSQHKQQARPQLTTISGPAALTGPEVLNCPETGCTTSFEVSTVDPDATLSEVVNHLTGYPHYRDHATAMRLLATV